MMFDLAPLMEVSTHAPLAGSDTSATISPESICEFQPTLPLRGATASPYQRKDRHSRFNPRSPCGERRLAAMGRTCGLAFQPTLPLRGATMFNGIYGVQAQFQPTLPLRGATMPALPGIDQLGFNPRSPCGERRGRLTAAQRGYKFQPTLPLRGATYRPWTRCRGRTFQPTLPLRGATFSRGRAISGTPRFNPRSPCGERRQSFPSCPASTLRFNPRSPCGERPARTGYQVHTFAFQPTLPLRGATRDNKCIDVGIVVSTHAPLAGSDLRMMRATL